MRRRSPRRILCIAALLPLAAGILVVGTSIPSGAAQFFNNWGVVAVPATGPIPVDVSCWQPTHCIAIGGGMIEQSTGSRWTIDTSAPSLDDYGISCPSASFCIVVGAHSSVPGIEEWNGSTWRLLSGPKANGFLSAVSCTSPSNCVAIGQYSDGSELTEVWNGPNGAIEPPVAHAVLNSISCVSASSPPTCFAVGLNTSSKLPMAEMWKGGWSEQAEPPITGYYSSLNAISCPATNDCTAVGEYDQIAESEGGDLVEHWNGLTWTVTDLNRRFLLTNVSCSSSTYCSAIGLDTNVGPESGTTPLYEFDGHSWSDDQNPTYGIGPGLTGISCNAPGHCTAVGQLNYAGQGPFPLVVTTPPPIPPSAYQEVAADGGVFSFAPPGIPADFFGSMGGQHLNAPIVGITLAG